MDVAKYGTGALKMARKKASQLEKTFTSKTGHQLGVEMWRVEQVK